MNEKNALIIIDLQNDFCPGGALAVNDGDKTVPLINEIMPWFKRIIATQDWHPAEQVSFASNHKDKKPYDILSIDGIEQTLWPDHCVQGTPGAAFHSGLDTNRFDLILRKGTSPKIDSYSAFLENDRKTKTGLEGYLKALNISDLFFCGLATDFCVFYSAMDAMALGFNVSVIIDACRGIDIPENNINNAISKMKSKGIRIIESGEL